MGLLGGVRESGAGGERSELKVVSPPSQPAHKPPSLRTCLPQQAAVSVLHGAHSPLKGDKREPSPPLAGQKEGQKGISWAISLIYLLYLV